ncbi:MAG: 2-C-methyl-D-erythritol 4-phosphate cytidylyltransferase [Gemmatimonadota bacterium]
MSDTATPSTALAILPAAGRGIRAGGPVPKQYQLVAGHPVLWHTLDRFEASGAIHAVVLVVRPEDRSRCEREVLAGARFAKVRAVVDGGAERRDSVRAGLAASRPEDEVVVVHDAVRPLVSGDLISRVVAAAAQHGAAIPAMPATETVKEVRDGAVVSSPDRERLWFAQTPQGFRREVLMEALRRVPPSEPVTDESMLVERAGNCVVRVLQGERDNVKITTAADVELAARRLAGGGHPAMRVGLGYDVHPLVAGRKLVLGGVEVPWDRGLGGHSDADVLTHAIVDALLGAAAMGDIGRLFPDTSEAYRGICSLLLLEDVVGRLAGLGARTANVDAVVMAQAPRLAPHVPAMVAGLARALRVDPGAVSVKATTTERLGFIGRQEGIAAQAVAMIYL